MAERSAPAQDSVAAQQEMFRLAKNEHSLSCVVLKQRNKHLSLSTLRSWADGASAMPAYALGELRLAGVPDDLLSLVMAPFALAVISGEPDDGDLDTAANDCLEFAAEVTRAHHPNSPGGLAIVPQEKAVIAPKLRRACASTHRVGRARA